MNEDQYQKATNLRQRIALMKAFLYAIDRNTVGTLGHTGFMQILCKNKLFKFLSRTNSREYVVDVPKDIVTDIGELVKVNLAKMQKEFDEL